ncbi:uncharacterized protein [Macrobrachium rosenbergii]|uniref:uncharacterized protein n=1 Tax=Macrobrachium rosenbergii TaxID=79674 RepID=UPI0034D423C3
MTTMKLRQDKLEAREEEESSVYKTSFKRASRKEAGNSSKNYRREDDACGYRREDKRFVCYACSQLGHITRNCPKFEESKDKEERRDNEERRYKTEDKQNKSKKNISGKKAQYESDENSESEFEEEELTAKVAKPKINTKAIVADSIVSWTIKPIQRRCVFLLL